MPKLWLQLFCAVALSGCDSLEHFPKPEFKSSPVVIEDCSHALPKPYQRENYQETLLNFGEPSKSDTTESGRKIIDYDAIDATKLALCDQTKPHSFAHLHFEYNADGLPVGKAL